MRRILFTLGLLAVSACRTDAATLRLYTPGGAPCAGACTFEWAKTEFAVPDGAPRPLVIPKGSVIHLMSYAKDGQPRWVHDSAIFADDQPGQGYEFRTKDGRTLWMVQIAECQNWAVVSPPIFQTDFGPPPAIATLILPPGRITPEPEPECVFCGPPPPRPCPDCEPPPPAVPLPGSAGLLAAALAVLAAFGRSKRRRA